MTNHQGDLEAMEKLLKRRFLPEKEILKEFTTQLEKIGQSINQALETSDLTQKKFLESQRELVHDLAGRCHHLSIRRDVIAIAEDAEMLANASPESSERELLTGLEALRDRIDSFLEMHRPSKTNSKFLRFARACLAKAEKREPVVIRGTNGRLKKMISIESFQSKEVTLEMFDLAEALYQLAGFLYHHQLEDFDKMLKHSFCEASLRELRFHLSMTGASLEHLNTKKGRFFAIQGILGYAHEITDYYMDDSPYPTIVEIHRIFKDLDFINHLEE